MAVRVLITGGAGFIGSHLCDAFIDNGDKVEILDNLSTGALKNISHIQSNINVIKGDIRDKQLVESLVLKSDLVLHMAAAVGVHTILEKPIESISTNFAGSEIVLNACVKYRKKIVIASTSEIYGKNAHQPLSETDDRVMGAPQKLRWSYADSKALEEAMAHALFLANGLEVITLRFFNVVGPRQLGSYGMVLPRFVESALGHKPINVFGDGNQTRVFCHVLDAVNAILRLVSSEKAIGEVFNIGGREEISIKNLALKVIDITKSESKVVFSPYSDSYEPGFEDMLRRVPDLAKIKSFIDWDPNFKLDQIIQDVANSIS
jgi:UDP-glucose 4-epimerase